ncbi:MAG TPA: site-2 protease family protein [Candidatus Limnocylindrales bacterium]|nr:site-2 protease family protein [Candidatus Limnocylindrales bacterium]
MTQNLLPALTAVAIMLLIAFPVHEFSHALAAFRLGDSTARYMGRLTLDPRVHFDPMGALMLAISAFVGVFIGWAKPTPVNPTNLQGGRRGEAIVAVAGPVSNLVLAVLVAIPLRLIGASPEIQAEVFGNPVTGFVYGVLEFFVLINVFLFIFNLLPIPPLDGWKVLTGLVDSRTAYNLRQVEQYGFILIIVILLAGGRIIGPIGFGLFELLVGA